MTVNALIATAAMRLWLIVSVAAAAQDEVPIQPLMPKREQPIDFQRDVLPILRSNCIACHNTTTNENDLILETPKQIIHGGSAGAGVVPGKPDESLVYQVAARTEEPIMPPLPNDAKAKTLTPEELGVLRQWIIEGAKAGVSTGEAIAWVPVNDRLKAVYNVDYHERTGTIAASRADRITLYDIHEKKTIGSLVDPVLGKRSHRDVVQSLAFHPTEPLLASGGYRTVKFWRRGPAAVVLHEFDQPVQRFAVSNDGSAAVSFGTRAHLLSLTEADSDSQGGQHPVLGYARLNQNANVTALCFSSNGELCLAIENGTVEIIGKSYQKRPTIEFKPEAVQLGMNKKYIVVALRDDRLYVVDRSEKQPVPKELLAAASPVGVIAFGGGETQAFTGHSDGSVIVWDLSTLKNRRLKADGTITGIAASPDGKQVSATTNGGKTVVWDIASGKQLAVCQLEYEHQRKLAKNAFEKRVTARQVAYRKAKEQAAKTEVESQEKTLKTANETVAKTKKSLDDATGKRSAADKKVTKAKTTSLANPDDKGAKAKLDAATKNQTKGAEAQQKAERAFAAAKKDVEIVKSSYERAKKTLEAESKRRKLAEALSDKLTADLGLLKDTPKVAEGVSVRFVGPTTIETVHRDGTIRVWDTNKGSPVLAMRTSNWVSASAKGYALSEDRRKLLRISRTPEWQYAGAIDATDCNIVSRVRSLAFSPYRSLLAIGSGEPSRSGQILIWDVQSRKLVREISNAHSDTVLDLEFSPDGKLLLSCGADKFARIWTVADGSLLRSFEGHTHHLLAASWQADMTRVFTAGGDKTIKVWDAETGEQKRTITTYQKQVTGLQSVGTADLLISCSGDRTVRSFTANNGRSVRAFSGSTEYVHTLATARDGSIVVVGSEDGIVRAWNGTDGKVLANFAAE